MRHRQWLVLVLFQWHFHRKLAVPCAVNPHHIIARIHTATQLERSSYFRYLPKNQRFFVVFLLLLFILAAKGKHSKMSSNTTKIYRHMYSHSRLFFMPSHFPISYSLYLSFSILYDRKSVWKRIVQDVVLTLILVYRLTEQKKITLSKTVREREYFISCVNLYALNGICMKLFGSTMLGLCGSIVSGYLFPYINTIHCSMDIFWIVSVA